MKLQILFITIVLFLASSDSSGENKALIVVPREAFSDAAVSLPPRSGFLRASSVVSPSPATRMFYKWGITLRGGGSTLPTVLLVRPSVNPDYDWSIHNVGASNAAEPMIIDLEIPARRVGFFLSVASESTSVKAFDNEGEALGSIDLSQSGWLGLESTGVKGISKLVIDNGDSTIAEKISDPIVEFISGVQMFEVYIPQFADGQALVDDRLVSLISVLRISNLQEQIGEESRISVLVEFFDDVGQPLSINTNSGTGVGSGEFSLDAAETLVIRTDGNSNPVASGYVRIRADGPIGATAEFTAMNEGGIVISEAGISAVGPVLRSVGAVVSESDASSDTALALVNPAEEESNRATVHVRVLSADFSETTDISLEPGQHVARFVREIFPSLPADFEGSVLLSSGVPIAATILRTRSGLPFSSLQLDSLERGSTAGIVDGDNDSGTPDDCISNPQAGDHSFHSDSASSASGGSCFPSGLISDGLPAREVNLWETTLRCGWPELAMNWRLIGSTPYFPSKTPISLAGDRWSSPQLCLTAVRQIPAGHLYPARLLELGKD